VGGCEAAGSGTHPGLAPDTNNHTCTKPSRGKVPWPERKRKQMQMKKVLLGGVASAAVAVAIAAPDAGVVANAALAHADYSHCRVNASGAMWCEDNGYTWDQDPQGTYPDNPYCSPYVHRVQCGD
jgi:hypothetical protein